MQISEETAPRAGEVGAGHATPRRRSWPRVRLGGGAVAVTTWIVGLALARALVHVLDPNPLFLNGAVMPIAVGSVVGVALVVFALRRRLGDRMLGFVAGAFASWVGLVMLTALHGTPFGYDGMDYDEGNLIAQAMKYMTSWAPVDAYVRHVPTEYPPLFPWLVGHVASWTGRPAWHLMGPAQVVVVTGGYIAAFLLWRRLVDARVALLIAAVGVVIPYADHHGDMAKAYEILVMVTVTPWILAAFLDLPRARGGMHWLPAGVIGGLLVLSYPAYLVFAALGLLALVAIVWRRSESRAAYLGHVFGVLAVAFVVSSWYVLPWLTWRLSHPTQSLSDLYWAGSVGYNPLPLPFFQIDPMGVLELTGAVGLLWLRKRAWWAEPLLLLVISTYVYRALWLLVLVVADHTGYLEYTDRLTNAVLVAAGVLTLAAAWPAAHARLVSFSPRLRPIAVGTAAAALAWLAVQTWLALIPYPVAIGNQPCCPQGTNFAMTPHVTPLANGQFPRYSPQNLVAAGAPVYPIAAVERDIRQALGDGARPVVLSDFDRIFAFDDYYAYLPTNRLAANSLIQWDARINSLHQLATVTDPTVFAADSARLPFGRIDVFLLRRTRIGWTWNANVFPIAHPPVSRVVFRPESFGASEFDVRDLNGGYVIAIRRPTSG